MTSYDVEEILDSRRKGKSVEYLVRWAPTWEAERNLNCAKLLKEFKEKSGDTNESNGDANVNEDNDDTEDTSQTNSGGKRGRLAARNADKKRKASQKKSTPKKGKAGRRRR